MSIRLQFIIGIGIAVALAAIVNMIRRGKIDLRYALPWLALGMCLLILDIFPGIPGWLARLMGIELPINMLFFFGFCFSLIIIFLLTMSLSRMTVKIKQLSQELALLEKRVENQERSPEKAPYHSEDEEESVLP
ncbi:DUF2304 domain-containing protein [Lachnotalea sp. AF33-28]|uniref:DUF2304 domain-containing protein n=1 Tax=Lachnotalea sp. AF33-28 TaxID=2292046 RepID=UPI000E50B639|nr:DUF2304 domain-containing protein [Lachnotalea sp. AF33-28]RHP35168.1 DUF2304 domain-containing protein [Lachnotalea sp. AF33-28]